MTDDSEESVLEVIKSVQADLLELKDVQQRHGEQLRSIRQQLHAIQQGVRL
ncbi:MAG: hypothetical protein KDN22_10975 [Verrucomicrobiae bacterium]|nr:hypothetical protein [Verrucomicrobiae bacterium]